MFDLIIRFSLRNRAFVLAGAVLLLAYGILTLWRLPVDVFPDLNRPTVTLMTEAGGYSPEEVELLITQPIEVALNGAPGVQRVRSTSGVGLSVIYVEFDWQVDLLKARQLTTERLQVARERLPEGIVPTLGPIASIMGEILLVGLYSETGATSPMDLRAEADWVLRPRLMAIPGVAQVIAIGGGVRQVQVRVSPRKLAAAGLTLDEVEAATRAAQGTGSGGFVERKGQELLVRTLARTVSVEDLADTVVAVRAGVPIRLRQVAEVVAAPRVKRGDAAVGFIEDGKPRVAPAVILSIQKQPGAHTVELTRQIEAVLADARPARNLADSSAGSHTDSPAVPGAAAASDDLQVKVLFQQSAFIERAMGNVESALREGAILVAVVLLLFLLNLRTTFITLTAIPLSLVAAVLVLDAFGLSINTMTLGGMAVAIGELVDDAIVDVENVFRRLRENRQRPEAERKPALAVVYAASSEVRNAIVYATIVVILVFVPLFALSGIEGRLFAPLGVAYIVAILASLAVSLTVTPVLAYYLLPRLRGHERDGALVRFLKARHRSLLHVTLHHPNAVIVGAAGLVIAAALAVPGLGREFLPPFNEGTVTINLLAEPGTALSESNRLGDLAQQLVLAVPEVVETGRRTGRAELDEHAEGVHYTEIDVDLRASERSRAEILADMRTRLAQLAGVRVSLGQPISHRLDHLLSGVRAQLAVKIFGPDLETLRPKAEEVAAAMAGVPGIVDLQVEQQVLIPQIAVRVDRARAAAYGLQPGRMTDLLDTALGGRVVGQVLDGARSSEILLRYEESARLDPQAMRDTWLDTPSGARVRLGAVADVIESFGPNQINHENARRRIVVSANTNDRDLAAVVADVQARVHQVDLAGFEVSYGGQFESQASATRLISLLSLLSLALIFLVLHAHFRDVRLVLQILLNIPLALIGAVAALWITGGVLSVASLVGFITLCGIASRNTIMMISHYLHLARAEGEVFGEALIIRGSLERLVPMLMTALTAGLALIPLALASGEPGKELLHPVAVVILGGLISATLLDLIVTPAVFLRFGRRALTAWARPQPDVLNAGGSHEHS